MAMNISYLLTSRRQFLTNLLPAGPLFCLGCGNLFASSKSGGWSKNPSEKHKFQNDSGMTYEEVFRFKYGSFISTIQILANAIGKEKFLEMLKQAISEVVAENTKKIIQKLPDNNLDTFIKMMVYTPLFKNTLTFDVVEQTDNVFEMRVTECLWAKIFREAKEPDAVDIGYAFGCYPEFVITQTFNPQFKLILTKTLMQGHDCCNQRTVWER